MAYQSEAERLRAIDAEKVRVRHMVNDFVANQTPLELRATGAAEVFL